MKNLLVVVRSISFGVGVGGMERAATQHIYEMHSKGYQILLIAPKNKISGDIPDFIKFLDVPWPIWDKYKILMTMGVAYYRWCQSVADKINASQNEIDIIHFHGASAGTLSFMPETLRKNKVTVVNPHGMEEFGTGSLLRLINRSFTRNLLKKSKFADVVIATDTILIENVKTNLNIDVDKICVIPNTIDVVKLKSLAKRSSNIDEYRIVSVGRMEYNKGYDLLASVLESIKRKGILPNEISWNHYGNGKMKDEIIKYSKKNNINLCVHVGASDKDVQSAIANSGVFVQPSRYEGSSLTTLEAMAHSALIVAMPVGGIPDKIFNFKTGFLSKEVTTEQLELSLCAALTCIKKNEIKHNAQSYVLEHFDINISTKKYDKLYNDIYSSKRNL